jgi:hypothetical protein
MDNKCPGCQRNDIHKMCPAHGTPFYMSGIPYSEELEKIIAVLSPEDRQVIFDTCMFNRYVNAKPVELDRQEIRELGRTWPKEEKWCPNCDKYTYQRVKWSGHERDSTYDQAICLACKWEYNGFTGNYEPPYDEQY